MNGIILEPLAILQLNKEYQIIKDLAFTAFIHAGQKIHNSEFRLGISIYYSFKF